MNRLRIFLFVLCYCHCMLDCTFRPPYLKVTKQASCLTLVPLLHVFIYLLVCCKIKLDLWEFLKIITSSALVWSNLFPGLNYCVVLLCTAVKQLQHPERKFCILSEEGVWCSGPIFCPWARCGLYIFIKKSHLQTGRIINWGRFPG